MINFMVLASDAEKIRDYYKANSGGDIDIEFCFSSLHANFTRIMNSNIRVDKFLIVFSDESNLNVKQEMACLREIMEKNSFFRIGEIIVYSEENEYCTIALDHFKFVMECLEFSSYQIKTTKEKLTMQFLYRDTLSIVPPDKQKTSYNKVYRVRKGEDSKVGYDAVRQNLVYQTVVKDGYAEYEKVKHNAIKSESGRVVSEVAPKEIERFEVEVDVYHSNFNAIKNVIIFTGPHKTGTSILCSKTFLQLNNALLVDMSRNQGSVFNINTLDGEGSVEKINVSKLLLGELFVSNSSKLIPNVGNNINIELLKYLLSIPNRLKFDTLVIDVDLEDLESVLKVLHMRIKTLIFTSDIDMSEVNNLKPLLTRFKIYNQFLYLNNCSKYETLSAVNPLELRKEFDWLKIITGDNLVENDLDLTILVQ